MRKSKGRKTGKAAKKDDAQNGEPEVDSNEVDEGNDEEDTSSNKKKGKASKRSSSRSSEVKNYNEDEAEESEEEEEENNDEESSQSSKKSTKRKSAGKKGGKKAKAAKPEEKSEDDEEEEVEEESSPKKAKKSKKAPAKSKGDEGSSDDDASSQEEYEVEKIIDVYFKKNGEKEFLVRWKGYSSKEDTWEPESHLNCKDLIASYLKKCEEARNVTQRETRVHRKTTDRYIVNAQDTGRKLSGRHKGKPRKTYFEDND